MGNPIEQHPEIDRVNPYMSTIQTNRSGLIHVLTEMQVFRDQIPTQVQFKQEDYIDGGSVIAQRRCPEEMYSQIVDFLQKPLPD